MSELRACYPNGWGGEKRNDRKEVKEGLDGIVVGKDGEMQ